MGETKGNLLFDNPITNRLVTKRELAEVFGVSTRTIDRLVHLGLGENAGAVIGGHWRFNVASAWEWFRKRGT
jgi:phage terminase Nu1 subunit (DNA packaging protein)